MMLFSNAYLNAIQEFKDTIIAKNKYSFQNKPKYLVSGPLWKIYSIKITSGSLFFESIGEVNKQVTIFMPKNSLMRFETYNAEIETTLICSESNAPFNINAPICIKEELNFIDTLKNLNLFEKGDSEKKINKIALDVKCQIDELFRDGIRISDISNSLNIHQSTVSRKFKKFYNITPKKYLVQLRVSYAEYLLIKKHNIYDACYNSGYRDLSRFYKEFKINYSDSPKSFQAKMTLNN